MALATRPLCTKLGQLTQRLGRRWVSKWSPLASAFNAKPTKALNLSLTRGNAGLFCIPELTDYRGFYLLQQRACDDVEKLVEEATSPKRTRKMVVVFDELSDTLCRVADMADFVRVSHPDQDYSMAAEEACVGLSGLVEKLNTDTSLHQALKSVIDNGDSVPTDDVDNRVAQLFMFDFEQSGIHLPADKREQFVKLNENILMLGSYFVQRTHRPSSVPKDKLPQNLRYCFNVDGDNISVTGLCSDHYSDVVRETAYKTFLYPDHHQLEILDALLHARHQLAQLVGFPTYAHRATRGTILENPESVTKFLQSLSDKLKDRAGKDYADILHLKQRLSSSDLHVMPWDPPYYSAIGRQERCNASSTELSPFFSLGSCIEGLNHLFRSLYNVTLQRQKTQPGECWSHDVHKLAVVHEAYGVQGYIYCDFFERAGKPPQDCHFTIQGGREKRDGSYQLPVVVLQLNLPPPQSRSPSLLTPGAMENLFHEFGHAMHSMLGRTKYQHVTGTRCSTDFAEVPSVLMEFFAADPRVLSTFARHYKTGEPLAPSTIQDLCLSKRMYAASEMQLQVFYSVLDQVYHGSHPLGRSTTQVLADLQAEYHGTPYIDNTAWQLRFGHLVGYGAKYYSYLLSRAVASKIWYQSFNQNPFSRESGELYRREVLDHGGEKPPTQLVQGMLGETPTAETLVMSLVQDLDEGARLLAT
ncbi:mitochondrial intermediate peptidase-like [Haliotis rubra]|uniref:mitochondrial intermediate peptidase-like n=1 Tax=Haliotis rubra TaxID=36100 RepID=UPI001EE5CAA1|nr:mitochondrial intermediate peptidase-like [Haliotis rubra]